MAFQTTTNMAYAKIVVKHKCSIIFCQFYKLLSIDKVYTVYTAIITVDSSSFWVDFCLPGGPELGRHVTMQIGDAMKLTRKARKFELAECMRLIDEIKATDLGDPELAHLHAELYAIAMHSPRRKTKALASSHLDIDLAETIWPFRAMPAFSPDPKRLQK
jgi:hypothetical protein